MFISKFQVFNYKGFLESNLLEFSPGINIIVGPNNSGKTALLETLTLNFIDVAHRSIKTLPKPSSRVNEKSSVKFSLTLDKQEFRDLLEVIPSPVSTVYSADNKKPETVFHQFIDWLSSPDSVELSLPLLSGGNISFLEATLV